MKRTVIAVCLLVLSPSGVMACYEEHSPAQAGLMNGADARQVLEALCSRSIAPG